MPRALTNRLRKIEEALEPEKGEWLKFPCRDGSFVEVPGCRSLVDVIALCSMREKDKELDETERK
jgi:hypothetical protein